jgi:hypothetical protein
MKKIFIIQPRVGTAHNEILALQLAAKELDWDVHPAPGGWRLDEEITSQGLIGTAYGSQTFCEVIAQQMGWKLKQNPFDWLAKVPKFLLRRQVDFMTLGEAKKLNEKKFIKPADDKCFDAKVYDVGEFNPPSVVPDDYPVLVSEVVNWSMEYRCFVDVPHQYARSSTWSNYLFHGQINEPTLHQMIPGDVPHIETFLSDVIDYGPPLVPSVVDVGIIPGKGWAVIETNPAWASGLYGCDPISAFRVIADSIIKE